MKNIIALLMMSLFVFVTGCSGDQTGDPVIDEVVKEIPEDIEQQFARCAAMLNDPNVRRRDDRQINTLTCFKELAILNYPIDQCLTFERSVLQIGCLIGFARANHDLHLCEIPIRTGQDEIVVDDCIENAMESVEQCNQVQDPEQRETCQEREPKGIKF